MTTRKPLWTLPLCLALVTACDDPPTEPVSDPGVLNLSGTSVAFEAEAAGASPAAATLDVMAEDGDVGVVAAAVRYPAQAPVDWLSAELSGMTPPLTLTVTADVAALAWGFYQSAVVVSGSQAANEPHIIFVALDLRCPEAAAGTFAVCGTLHDVETGEPLRTALDVRAYDAVAFASNPDAATPLSARSIVADASGRFHVVDAAVPTLGTALITSGAASATDHVLSGTSMPVAGGDRLTDAWLPALRRSTVDAWTSSAAIYATGTFADSGAVLSVFIGDDGPAAGVEAVVPSPDTSFYFDAASSAIVDVDPTATHTGADGAALTIRTGLDNHSGQGGEPAGCEWPSALAASVPGLVWVLQQVAVVSGTSFPCR